MVAESHEEVITRAAEPKQPSGMLGGITWNKRGEAMCKKARLRGTLPTTTESSRKTYCTRRHHREVVKPSHGRRPLPGLPDWRLLGRACQNFSWGWGGGSWPLREGYERTDFREPVLGRFPKILR